MRKLFMFPAQAGVILILQQYIELTTDVPRTSGGDPILFKPKHLSHYQKMFPAQAGVILLEVLQEMLNVDVPRTSGGDPVIICF